MFVRPFTDLLRQPNNVAKDVDEGDVILRRRGAPDLRLTRADREVERATAVAGLARALRSLAADGTRVFHRAIEEAFPWTGALPAADRRTFADEVSRLLAAGADLGAYGPVTELVSEWRSRAEAHAAPRRTQRRTRRDPAADTEASRAGAGR